MQTLMESYGLTKLSPLERLGLVQELWDSLAAHSDDMGVSEHHKVVLEERLDDCAGNPREGSTWEEVKNRISRKDLSGGSFRPEFQSLEGPGS